MPTDERRAALESAVTRVLARHVAGFRALTACERLSGGASQETYRVVAATDAGETRLAMRRAPGGTRGGVSEAGPGLTVEARLFAAARAAGVPEPAVVHIFADDDGLGEGFLMEWLDGETLGARIVRDDAFAAIRPALARQCGEILARIHAIDLDAAGLAGALKPRTAERLVHESWDLYKAYATPQPVIDFTARWLLEHLPPPSPPRLVHGDFRNGNLMMTPERGVVGVLDWEIAHVGDPVRDLGWIATNSWRFGKSDLEVGGFGSLDDLLDGYASVAGVRVARPHVEFWMAFGSFWWAVTCLTMAQAYRIGLDRSVERAAIGRRSSEGQIDCVNLIVPGPVEPPPEPAAAAALDMPRADELLQSVRDFLRDDVMPATRGRTSFLARVGANSLDVVLRELALGPAHRARELAGLETILGTRGALEELRWKLVHALRDGSLPLDRPGLAEHLRQTVATQVAIDQPRYSGYRTALAAGQGSES